MAISPKILRQTRMTAVLTDRNPNMESDPKYPMDHWRCTLRVGQKRMSVVFSMGSGHEGREPKLAELLDCLASDANAVENAGDFADWCDEFGYDTDSRKAERTYKACVRQAASLKRLYGHDLYQVLLYEQPDDEAA